MPGEPEQEIFMEAVHGFSKQMAEKCIFFDNTHMLSPDRIPDVTGKTIGKRGITDGRKVKGYETGI